MMASFNANGVAGLSDTSYRYDAVGRRVSKTISGTPPATTVYVSAGQRVIAEYEDSSPQPTTPSRRLVFGSFIDEPIAMFSAAQPLSPIYYHTNRQQSVYSLTDDAGNVIEHVAYTPFGDHQCFASDGTPEGHIPAAGSTALFTGRDYDSESGLHYFRARSYHPGSGQFLSRDPLEYVDGPNAYHGWYAPASVDPLGLFRPGIHESITRNALGNSGLPAGCIDLIVQGNVYQDVFNLGEPRDHGDNNTIRQTIDRIRDRWNNVVTSAEFSCDPCPCFVRDMFAEFGRLLHAVQDLYSHSTYVEVNGGTVVAGGGGNAQLGQIPLWPFFNNGNNAVSGSPTPVPGTVPNVPPGVVTGTWPDFLARNTPWLADQCRRDDKS